MPTTVSQIAPGWFRSLAGALSLIAASAAAQPSGMSVQTGAATLSQQGQTLVVSTRNGPGAHSSLQWQQFSIPAGHSVRFEQPSTASLSINRVVGGTPSAIQGQLTSNGKLVLVNPAGITVHAGAVVDTAGFTASTVNGSDADFLSGRFGKGRDLAGPAADLVVEGRILARHGDVVLVGGNLRQAGAVEAIGIGLEGGRVVLRALDEARVTGELRARRDLAGTVNVATASGEARRAAATSRGGAIDVFGARVVLESTAQLDVSGPAGGGLVRVGGDFQGANPELPNAQAAEFAAGARIVADATVQGDGGRVVLWSDGRTHSAGVISARGGPQGGDGGFVEVSGKQQLAFSSVVDARAPQGHVGQLLLDPGDFELVGGNVPAEQTGDLFQIGLADLLASDADIALISTGAITVSQALEWTKPYSLSLEARSLLAVNAPIQSLGGGALQLRTNGGMFPDGPVTSSLQIAAPITASAITVSASGEAGTNLTLQGADLMALSGPLTLTAPTISLAGNNRLWASGGVDIAGQATVQASATLRLLWGDAGAGQIHLVSGSSLRFAGPSSLVAERLSGATRPQPGPSVLMAGDVGGTLPTLSGGPAGTRLRWGSLEAVVPTALKKALLPEGGGGGGGTGPAAADPEDPDCVP